MTHSWPLHESDQLSNSRDRHAEQVGGLRLGEPVGGAPGEVRHRVSVEPLWSQAAGNRLGRTDRPFPRSRPSSKGVRFAISGPGARRSLGEGVPAETRVPC